MTTASVKQDGLELARDNRGWVQALMSAGYVARGVIYMIMGLLALQLALGQRKGEADQAGALAEIGAKPFGKALLIAMAMGLAAYGLWHLIGGGLNFEGEDALHRALRMARFLIYGVFSWSTLRFALDDKQQGGDEKSKDFTAKIIELPAGRVLVALLGLVFIAMAAYAVRQASGDRYKEDLKTWEIPSSGQRAVEAVARTGLFARGFVFALIGVFFLQAAWQADAAQAKGIDDALRRVAQAPYGKVALGLLAVGLICFGVYSLVEARYHKVMSR